MTLLVNDNQFFEEIAAGSYTQIGQLNNAILPLTILEAEAGGPTKFVLALKAILTSFQPNGTPTYTKNWAGLVQAIQAQGGGATPPNSTASFQDFATAFKGITGADSGNWSALQNMINQFPTQDDFFNDLTQKFLDQAIGNLTVSDVPNFSTAEFTAYISKWLTATGNFKSPQITDLPPSDYNTGAIPDLNTYQNVYQAFHRTTTGFSSALETFYRRIIDEQKYFVPSQFLENWVETVSATSGHAPVTPGTGSDKTKIIFELLQLVKDMIGTLEDLSSAQVQRLKFYSSWQQAYTDLISKIPVVTVSKIGSKIKGNDQQKDNALRQVGQYNDTWTQKLRAFRDTVSDETKAHQTAVNQTKESLNSQSSLATTLLQNLSTILQSIFR